MTERTLPRECRLGTGRPKVRYESRADAKAAARRHNLGEHAYKCRHCGYFHLASARPEPVLVAVEGTYGAQTDVEQLAHEVAALAAKARRDVLELHFYAGFLRAARLSDGPSFDYDGGFRGTFVREAR